jgi:hypothetical protein
MTQTARHRERDSRVPLPQSTTETLCNGSQNIVDKTTNSLAADLYNGRWESCDDVVTSDFRKRQARGEIINNPFDKQVLDCEAYFTMDWSWLGTAPCSGTVVKGISGGASRSFGNIGWLDKPARDTATLRVLAGTQAAGNVVAPDVLGGENLREVKETMRMLGHPLENFHLFLDKVRRSKGFNNPRAYQLLTLGQYIANEWLKFRYGATPLIHDLVNGYESMTRDRVSNRQTARGSASGPLIQNSDTVAYADGFLVGNCERTVEIRDHYVRAGILYDHHFTFGDKLGLSAHNIIPTLWEFLPYSFVADWFVNVGDWLAAVTPKAGVRKLATWTTEHATIEWTRSLTSSVIPLHTNDTGGLGVESKKTYTHVTRTPGIAVGLSFRTNDLDFQKSKNWLHFADGMALAGQYLRCSRKTPPPRLPRSNKSSNYAPWKQRDYRW